MKTPLRNILLITISAACMASCVTKSNIIRSDYNAVVTIAPLKFIVDEITNNSLDVSVLVPYGASPETYEPTPKQIIEISNSAMIFTTGLIDFETRLTDKISSIGVNLVNLSEDIQPIHGSCAHQHSRFGNEGEGVDPHIWTSPKLIKKMATTAYAKINLLFPDSVHFLSNYHSLEQKLDSLDAAIAAKVKNSPHKYFIIYHPALTYFANDYGIKQIALEQDGKEPSVAYLQTVISNAKRDGIKYVFYQSQFSRSTVESVAKEIGAQAVEINPLREDLINNLTEITDLIVK